MWLVLCAYQTKHRHPPCMPAGQRQAARRGPGCRHPADRGPPALLCGVGRQDPRCVLHVAGGCEGGVGGWRRGCRCLGASTLGTTAGQLGVFAVLCTSQPCFYPPAPAPPAAPPPPPARQDHPLRQQPLCLHPARADRGGGPGQHAALRCAVLLGVCVHRGMGQIVFSVCASVKVRLSPCGGVGQLFIWLNPEHEVLTALALCGCRSSPGTSPCEWDSRVCQGLSGTTGGWLGCQHSCSWLAACILWRAAAPCRAC